MSLHDDVTASVHVHVAHPYTILGRMAFNYKIMASFEGYSVSIAPSKG